MHPETPNPGNTGFRLAIKAFAWVVVAALLLTFFGRYVPIDMDELAHYNAMSCLYYPAMRNGGGPLCTSFDLAIFGKYYLPLRTYHYAGSFHGLIYFPLFLLWPSPHSARLLGIILLSLQALYAARIAKLDALLVFLVLAALLPYSYVNIADTGPVAFQCFAIFFAIAQTQFWKEAFSKEEPRTWIIPAGVGIVLFCAIWDKLFFLIVGPSLLIHLVYQLYVANPDRLTIRTAKRWIWQMLALLAAGLAPTLLLLGAKDRWQFPYYSFLSETNRLGILFPRRVIKTLWTRYSSFVLDPVTAAHVHFNTPRHFSFLGILLLLAISSTLLVALKRHPESRGKILVPLLSFLTFLFFLGASDRASAIHHFAIGLPFLFVSLFHALATFSPRARHAIVSMIVIVNIGLFARVPYLQIKFPRSMKLVALNNYVNRFASNHLIVVVDWGMCYIKLNYGPKNQFVACPTSMSTAQDARALRDKLKQSKRKMLVIASPFSPQKIRLLQAEFPKLRKVTLPFKVPFWSVLMP